MYNFKNIYIDDWYTIVGPSEQKSNLKKYNLVMNDYYFGEKTFENAEIKIQKLILNYFINKEKPDLVVSSDLMDQLIISSMCLNNMDIPHLGIYSACASSVSGIITLANMMQNKNIKNTLFITSTHNLNAEKQFRFPIEYGAPKPKRSTYTATGGIGIKLIKNEGRIKVISGTMGKIVDSYVKDAFNMGAVMAPSAVKTLLEHLYNTKKSVNDYDLILTGDLGEVGTNIFKTLLKNEGIIIKNHLDAGANIYTNNKYSGASGPVALPLYLFNNILLNKKYKKILLLATGSLHSPLLVNQKNSIPAITHALEIEVLK